LVLLMLAIACNASKLWSMGANLWVSLPNYIHS
jgi:hypothetical protein